MASTAMDVVRARVPAELKDDATEVLNSMGITMSDAIKLLLINIVSEKELPFTVKVPNRKTVEAMKAADRGEVHYVNDLKEILND